MDDTGRTLIPWRDVVLEQLGHDPRSEYAEVCWLPNLGPTAFVLLRRLATLLGRAESVEVDMAQLASAVGVAQVGVRHALDRLARFGFVSLAGSVVAVRLAVPPLSQRQIARLPEAAQVFAKDAA